MECENYQEFVTFTRNVSPSAQKGVDTPSLSMTGYTCCWSEGGGRVRHGRRLRSGRKEEGVSRRLKRNKSRRERVRQDSALSAEWWFPPNGTLYIARKRADSNTENLFDRSRMSRHDTVFSAERGCPPNGNRSIVQRRAVVSIESLFAHLQR